MSNRLGGFIAGQNIDASIGTFSAVSSPTFTFGSTQGTPAVGQAIQLTTTGTLPTGLSINTTYYVISTSTNTCQLSTTLGGSAVTFTNSSGSGTHTAVTQRAFNAYAGAPDTVEYLVVAGGGGGGTNRGGGAGAGGLLQASGFAVTAGTALTVTVGAGGTASANSPYGQNGNNSVFSSITATGGGAGANNVSTGGEPGSNGGSGGGARSSNATPSTGVSGQGNAGGIGSASGGASGGGGAGASPLSLAASTNIIGGDGGTGLCSTITGQRVFYAGGGGGGGFAANGGQGGAGGGGAGSLYSGSGFNATPGTANTGGGGGGASDGTGTVSGGAGGSGIVIVRYPQLNSAPALVTGSPQVSYADGYQIYTFTSSGSIIF